MKHILKIALLIIILELCQQNLLLLKWKVKKLLYSTNIDNILNSIFIREKKNLGYINEYSMSEEEIEKYNEVMKILHSNFDTDKKQFYNYEKCLLFHGLMEAYENHYPLTISPDMILILFLQGYSNFMEKHSEKVRNVYVNFGGQKTLTVKRDKMTPETAKPEDWKGIIDEFTEKIKGEIEENIISNLECNFTTTNPVTLTTSQISIMSSMKNYFIYEVLMEGCGISSITLEGTLEDWDKIKKKFEFFQKKNLV